MAGGGDRGSRVAPEEGRGQGVGMKALGRSGHVREELEGLWS